MLDVASQRKAPGGERAGSRLTPHDTQLRLRGCGMLPAGFGSRRQCHAQPSLAPHQGCEMKKVSNLKRRAQRLSWALKASTMTDNEVADALRQTADPFLRTDAWMKLRRLALEKYGLVCCKCGRENSRRFPINMDHIKPRKFFPELALDINNLQPLCGPCNKAKGNKDYTDYRK